MRRPVDEDCFFGLQIGLGNRSDLPLSSLRVVLPAYGAAQTFLDEVGQGTLVGNPRVDKGGVPVRLLVAARLGLGRSLVY